MRPGRAVGRREALRITAAAGLGAAFGGPVAAVLLRDARLHRVRSTRIRLGTEVTITAIHRDEERARSMVDAGFREMERLDAMLSRYRPDSALGRLNATGRLDAAPEELLEVLATARRIARTSGRAFDPTILPVLEVHGHAFLRRGSPPDERSVQAALDLVDHESLRVEGRSVLLDDPRMGVTLDGIAKGFVVDRTVAALAERGAERVLVDAGGDLASGGPASVSDPWLVRVEGPEGSPRYDETVALAGDAVATSGDYMQSFTRDRRAHHIIDPRTGRSPRESSSVSVTAPSAMLADAVSTTVMVLGPGEGIGFLESTPGVEGRIVTKGGDRLRTAGFGAPLGGG
ncbi:MAG: FAD:protein FMN transferase [Longimicrobiales bacterium]|nr:FAD:protein FMN transferase [Longimicrobiales bacterium]